MPINCAGSLCVNFPKCYLSRVTVSQRQHQSYFHFWRSVIDANLQDCTPPPTDSTELVNAAMNYSVASGHRWRPLIAIAAYEMSSGRDGAEIIDAACAVELIHTCTIIVDDLPCVDNASFRRGRLTCHRVYGEAVTVYSSHLLYAKAERLACENATKLGIDGLYIWNYLEQAREALVEAQVQELNLNSGNITANAQSLDKLYELKSYPFIIAGWLASVFARLDEQKQLALVLYSKYLGIAYQIIDDIQDTQGDPARMGKAVEMDRGRVNLARSAGVVEARSAAMNYIIRAKRCLNVFSEDISLLKKLVDQALGFSQESETPKAFVSSGT